MFSVVRQTWRRAPSVAGRAASFSTTPSRLKEDDGEQDPLAAIADILHGVEVPSTQQSSNIRWIPFKTGHVIKPYDFSHKARVAEPRYRKKTQVAPPSSVCRNRDVFHQLDLSPRDFTTNSTLLIEYVSEMSKIYGRNVTGLTAKNQRSLGRTIRRAKMMGIIPTLSQGTQFRPKSHK